MSINWKRPKFNPVPTNYDCLLMTEKEEVYIGRPKEGDVIIAWSVIDKPLWGRPKWSKPQHKDYKYTQFGEANPNAWLSDEDCSTIRELYEQTNLSYRDIAIKYECSKSTIRDIVTRRTRFRTNTIK